MAPRWPTLGRFVAGARTHSPLSIKRLSAVLPEITGTETVMRLVSGGREAQLSHSIIRWNDFGSAMIWAAEARGNPHGNCAMRDAFSEWTIRGLMMPNVELPMP